MSENENTTLAELDQQIRQAMTDGDWDTSRQLKSQRHDMIHYGAPEGGTQVEAEAPPLVQESEDERDASLEDQIMQAVADGDWDTSRRLKSQLMDRMRHDRQARANGGRR